jgi:hypothetical protein
MASKKGNCELMYDKHASSILGKRKFKILHKRICFMRLNGTFYCVKLIFIELCPRQLLNTIHSFNLAHATLHQIWQALPNPLVQALFDHMFWVKFWLQGRSHFHCCDWRNSVATDCRHEYFVHIHPFILFYFVKLKQELSAVWRGFIMQ